MRWIDKVLWLIPNLTWWHREKCRRYRLSFKGPHQTNLISWTEEELDPHTGQVVYAWSVWNSDFLILRFKAWRYRRAETRRVKQFVKAGLYGCDERTKTYVNKRLAFYGDTLTEIEEPRE